LWSLAVAVVEVVVEVTIDLRVVVVPEHLDTQHLYQFLQLLVPML
jgi:hypothetical protein